MRLCFFWVERWLTTILLGEERGVCIHWWVVSHSRCAWKGFSELYMQFDLNFWRHFLSIYLEEIFFSANPQAFAKREKLLSKIKCQLRSVITIIIMDNHRLILRIPSYWSTMVSDLNCNGQLCFTFIFPF